MAQTKTQTSGIIDGLYAEIGAMYINIIQRTDTTSCGEFEAFMREVHIAEIRLRNMEGKR